MNFSSRFKQQKTKQKLTNLINQIIAEFIFNIESLKTNRNEIMKNNEN
jgi:hypothetical protein